MIMQQTNLSSSQNLGFQPALVTAPILRRALIVLLWLCLAATVQAEVLVASNSVWHLFRGTNEASGPTGTEWRTNTFDDATWETRSAPFYFGTNFSPAGGTL